MLIPFDTTVKSLLREEAVKMYVTKDSQPKYAKVLKKNTTVRKQMAH